MMAKQFPTQFAGEEVESTYTYPVEYWGPKHIREQVDIIAGCCNLSPRKTLDFIDRVLPELTLPEGAEGWFAAPSVYALSSHLFSGGNYSDDVYRRADYFMVKKIGESRPFLNWRRFNSKKLRPHDRTVIMWKILAEQQAGQDIWIFPAQFGYRHRGRSVRRAREVFTASEFDLSTFAVASMLLTHPERLISRDDLLIYCAGSEEDCPARAGQFSQAQLFQLGDNYSGGPDRLELQATWFGGANGRHGSASGFLPL